MVQPQYAITMAEHQRNVCAGLSAFQQNGEFVDMTLAADGHLVKVHQVLMGYASPYLKELITSTKCPHPVIFLNKVSYTSLCGILEYIYTGEVHVPVDKINDLLEACHELRIHGLEHMNVDDGDVTMTEKATNGNGDRNLKRIPTSSDPLIAEEHDNDDDGIDQDELSEDISESKDINIISSNDNKSNIAINPKKEKQKTQLQYTVSNRGALQLILNRYMYFPGYFYKTGPRSKGQKWRCVDDIAGHGNKHCPAFAVIRDGMVLQRVNAHNHPYHDVRIMKKIRSGAVFSAVHDAEQEIQARRKANMGEKDKKDTKPCLIKETNPRPLPFSKAERQL